MRFEETLRKIQSMQSISVNSQINGTDENLFCKSMIDALHESNDRESFEKSFSGDLTKRFPNGGWRTINGAKVFVNGGKVVAGLDGFNGMIDNFFKEKADKEKQSETAKDSTKKNKSSKLSEKAKGVFDLSKKKFLKEIDPKKLQQMYKMVKDSVEAKGKGKESTDTWYDDDFVSAGKKFLEDKKIKEHMDKYNTSDKVIEAESKIKEISSNFKKNVDKLDAFDDNKDFDANDAKEFLNILNQIDERTLPQKTRDELAEINKNTSIMFALEGKDIASAREVDKILYSTRVEDMKKALQIISDEMEEKTILSFTWNLDKTEINNLIGTVKKALKEQSQKQIDELSHYKMF